jgi:hypothetical protein
MAFAVLLLVLQCRLMDEWLCGILQIMYLLIKQISPVTFAAVGPNSKIAYGDMILFCNYFVMVIPAVIND